MRCNRGLLDFALLQVVHIHMDTICVKVSFKLMNCGGNPPSPSMPVDIIVAVVADRVCERVIVE
jgi:hypothetical protein